MKNLKTKIEQKTHSGLRADVFKNEDGAIDLASIMVGIIIIGLIVGVIIATVFAVIPWTQDNAAKQQLDSVAAAQSSYMGLSSSTPPATPAGHVPNSYADSTKLEEASLMKAGPTYCTTIINGGQGYVAYSKSQTGNIWSVTDKNTKPVLYTGILPNECKFINGLYVDPTPKLTSLTYVCDADTTGVIPLSGNLTGTETWSDGSAPRTYTAAAAATPKTLLAGVTYTMQFDGTYTTFSASGTTDLYNLSSKCLTAVNHWGSETGVTNAVAAFNQATKLTDVPKNIPTTITDMHHMIYGTTVLNDPDMINWDVSNVNNMNNMFYNAKGFNQPIGSWNTGKVTNMNSMFYGATAFNQSLNGWNTSNVTDMSMMFSNAAIFNGGIDKWNTGNVTNMTSMFNGATAFNQPIGSWNVSKVQYLSQMFQGASQFNQPLNTWNTINATNMDTMFLSASSFNQPLNNWKTSNVQNMSTMFASATNFNQDLNNWDTSKVMYMNNMFQSATKFNGNVSTWTTTSLTQANYMFNGATSFNQPLNSWTTTNVTTMSGMFNGATSFNQPLNNWNTAKVTNMSQMFYNNSKFIQDISNWDQTALTYGTQFAPAATFPSAYKPSKTTLY